jgi:hypothetical protein
MTVHRDGARLMLALALVLAGVVGCTSHATAGAPASSPPSGSVLPATGAQSTSAAATSNVRYAPYTNQRFGFSLDIPTSLVAEQPPTDGDGLTYDGDGGLVTLTVYGEPNSSNVTPSLAANSADSGETVTSHSVDGPVAVVTGTLQMSGRTMIRYIRTVVGTGSLATLEWTYPASESAVYDAEVAHTVASFQPGDLTAVH